MKGMCYAQGEAVANIMHSVHYVYYITFTSGTLCANY